MTKSIWIHVVTSLVSLSAFGASAPGTPLSPQSALNKIHNRLLGDWPTTKEWSELKEEMRKRNCQQTSCLQDYFKTKIGEYMTNPRYVTRMSLKVEELLSLRSGAYSWDTVQKEASNTNSAWNRNSVETFNALSDLTRRVFQENLAWDDLFTAKTYNIFPSISTDGDTEISFYNIDQPGLNTSSSYPSPLRLDLANNPNVSGVFSTPRFLNRYWDSSLNQGRKRSAAVFRVMVCDTLFPSLERKSQAEDELSKSLGETEKGIAEAHTSQVVNKHATDQACVRCHQRLDPLAWSMRGLQVGLSTTAFPGYVRFYGEDGKLTKDKVDSFSEAIATFTKKEKYRSCQVDRFFRWIIGKDVALSSNRLLEIETQFDQVGRKTNDFIAALLLSKEFLTVPEVKVAVEPTLATPYEKASAVLTNCVACHGNSTPFSDLKKWSRSRVAWVAAALDLPHDGADRDMPPRNYTKWQPTSADIAKVKAWIAAGAPNEDGSKTLSDSDAKIVLGQE